MGIRSAESYANLSLTLLISKINDWNRVTSVYQISSPKLDCCVISVNTQLKSRINFYEMLL